MFCCLLLAVQSQTVVFYEDFESTPLTQVTSAGIPGWSVSTLLASGGLRSDSSSCINPGDSSVLTTVTPINTTGFGFVMLEFDHICKIEFYDAAYIEVSGDGGQTWIRLTGAHYLGLGHFTNAGNKFTSASYADWLPGNPSPPTNTWWKPEYFDISAIAANAASVRVRFVLKDENNMSLFDNYGWFIDNIRVTKALSELTPPSIVLTPPIWTGFKFSLGPFPVNATIIDTSGIDTAMVVYRVNGGNWDTIPMVAMSGSSFSGTIPAVSDLDTVEYFLIAIDASLSHNQGRYPSAGYLTLIASSGLYTPYFTDFETPDSLWTASTNSPQTRWEYGYPNYGLITGAKSGSNAWTINKDSLYGNNAQAILTSPYFNFSMTDHLILSFWQNRRTEATWDGMHLEYTSDDLTWNLLGGVNDPNGENWYTDTIYGTGGGPAWEGSSGGWVLSSYRLDALANLPMVRFRFVFTADPFVTYEGVSIDDFTIRERPGREVSIRSVISPVTMCDPLYQPVTVSVRNEGTDTLWSVPLWYHVTGSSGPVPGVIMDTIYPDSMAWFTFATLLNMHVTGQDSLFNIVIYTALPGDTLQYNDTAYHQVIAGAIPADPSATPFTIPYGTSVQLTALSTDTLFWYAQPSGGLTLHIGDTLVTPVLYDSVTYWVEARSGIGNLRFTELTWENTGLGCSNPYPPYIPPSTMWDGIEITNTGKSSVELTGYVFHMEGFKMIDFPLPSGVVLMPGEVMVLSLYASPALQPDTASHFYVVTSQPIYANSQLGFWLEAPDGSVTDAFAVNGYQFSPASQVTSADWSGVIPVGTGRAGVVRVTDDTNTASDWMLSDVPNPLQTIGSYNPMLPPILSLGCPGNRVPLAVYMASYPPVDAGVITILAPVSAKGLTATEPVIVVVRNFGHQPVSGISVSFSIDGGAPVTEIITDTILSGDTLHYTFNATAPLLPWQIYQFKAWTTIAGDTVPLNDTAAAQVIHQLPDYCASGALYTSIVDIGEVQVGALHNISSTGMKTYSDFTHLPPSQFIQGIVYPFTVVAQSQSTYMYNCGIKLFVDLNGDGQFDPVAEMLGSGLTSTTNNTVTGQMMIPYGSQHGLARLRVVTMYTSQLSSVLPCGTYSYGETEDYTIMIMPPLPYDAGVRAIVPFNPPLIEGSEVLVRAWIRNLGTDTLQHFPAGFMVQGQMPVFDTVTAKISPSDSILFTFPTKLTVTPGVFQLAVFTDLANDGYRVNDTMKLTLLGEKDFTVFYFDDFEHDDFNGWTPELTVLWQIGKPSANVINTAHSPSRVWTTRLNGNYLHNVTKGLITPEFNFSQLSGLSIRFWHWYETELGNDGGNVKYSVNGGNTFITLGFINDPMGVNWYNTNAAGKFSFSGSSGKWVYSSFDLSTFDKHPNPVSFKFDFFSNSTIALNGWAIDDFMITVEKAQTDAGVSAIILPVLTVPQGQNFQVLVRIDNFGKTPLTNIPLAVRINNGIEIQDTWTGNLQPGQAVLHTFATQPVSPGYMELRAYTKLPGDPYKFNDTAFRKVGHICVSETSSGVAFTVFPNPASNMLNVKIQDAAKGEFNLLLSDLTGRIVLQKVVNALAGTTHETLDLTGVAEGIYFLRLKGDHESAAVRVVVAR